jgi:hypothetical protein
MAVFRWRHSARDHSLGCSLVLPRAACEREEKMGEEGCRCRPQDVVPRTQRYAPELEKHSAWYRSRPILRSSSPRSPRSRARLVAILGLSSQGERSSQGLI